MKLSRCLQLLAVLLLFGSLQASEPVTLSLRDIDGKPHDIDQYRGRWVVVNYWASWCPPCIMEIPELIAFQERNYPDHAVVLGVNYERIEKRALQRTIDRLAINYTVLRADARDPGPFGRPFGLPVTFLIGPDGTLVSRHDGPMNRHELQRLIPPQAKRPASGGALPRAI